MLTPESHPRPATTTLGVGTAAAAIVCCPALLAISATEGGLTLAGPQGSRAKP
jgi:hypothetical protein